MHPIRVVPKFDSDHGTTACVSPSSGLAESLCGLGSPGGYVAGHSSGG